MKTTKLVSLLVLAAMTLGMIACGNPTPTPAETTAAPAVTEAAATTDTEAPAKKSLLRDTADAEIEKLGLKDYTFNIYMRKKGSMWSVSDLKAEELNGDIFNDTIFKRYAAIEERFGCSMEMQYSAGDHAAELSTYINANDNTYDFAFPSAQQCATFAQQGLLYDLYDVEYFDMESGNWNRMFCDEIEWQGRLYFAVGDMSTNGYRSVRIFLFNKALHAQNQFEDIYTLVREGKWTLDKMNTMATTAAADLNGDSQMSSTFDRFGMAWQSAISGYTLFYGADQRLTVKGEDGLPRLALTDETTQTAFEKIRSIITDKETYYLGTDAEVPVIFKEGRSFFYTGVLNVTEQMRDTEFDFGIIPTPKYDEAQAQYVQYVDSWCPSPVVVPINVKDVARSGFMIQLLAETGAEYTKPAYYDVVLTSKYARDPDSVEILDIIVNNFRLDNAVLYDWAGCSKAVLSSFTGDTGLASVAARLEKQVAKMITQTANKYNALP